MRRLWSTRICLCSCANLRIYFRLSTHLSLFDVSNLRVLQSGPFWSNVKEKTVGCAIESHSANEENREDNVGENRCEVDHLKPNSTVVQNHSFCDRRQHRSVSKYRCVCVCVCVRERERERREERVCVCVCACTHARESVQRVHLCAHVCVHAQAGVCVCVCVCVCVA